MAAAVAAALKVASADDCRLTHFADGWRVWIGDVEVGTVLPITRLAGGWWGWAAWLPNWKPDSSRVYPTRDKALVALVAALRRIGGVR